MRGHWELKAKWFDDSKVNEDDLEHIAEMIKKGYTSGELFKQEQID